MVTCWNFFRKSSAADCCRAYEVQKTETHRVFCHHVFKFHGKQSKLWKLFVAKHYYTVVEVLQGIRVSKNAKCSKNIFFLVKSPVIIPNWCYKYSFFFQTNLTVFAKKLNSLQYLSKQNWLRLILLSIIEITE